MSALANTSVCTVRYPIRTPAEVLTWRPLLASPVVVAPALRSVATCWTVAQWPKMEPQAEHVYSMETRPEAAGMLVPMAWMIKALALPHVVQSRSVGPRASDSPGRFGVDEVVMKITPK